MQELFLQTLLSYIIAINAVSLGGHPKEILYDNMKQEAIKRLLKHEYSTTSVRSTSWPPFALWKLHLFSMFLTV